jgi:ankyrin repeat protein
MEYLLSVGADPHQGDCDGDTPLHNCESAECVTLLVKAGAVVDARNTKGRTVCSRARLLGLLNAPSGSWRICAGMQPLYLAMKEEREEVIPALLAAGATPIDPAEIDFDDSDDDGDMDLAIENMIRQARLRGLDIGVTEFPDDGEAEDEEVEAATSPTS